MKISCFNDLMARDYMNGYLVSVKEEVVSLVN